MLEPDVTITDLVLTVQCAAFAAILFRRKDGHQSVNRHFAALFSMLAVSSLFGGVWHGFFSDTVSVAGDRVWFVVMAALAVAASLVWLLSGKLISAKTWSRAVRWVAALQLAGQLFASAFVTDSFMVAAIGLLLPIVAVSVGYGIQIRSGGAPSAVYGLIGFTMAALAGLVIVFDISLHPQWATTHAVYHMVQFVAFYLVFLSVPAVSQER